ncbi:MULTISPECIES: helix-turn-helix transcriptional regulator [unclassified Leptolyngbya]|uniref:helix-turn-helix domain-containing protein n=1 Tax=unclassified Leptolyngbya TaxID=2650499 RepID=UPI001685444C|nr:MULTISPECIES: helix-turn-helix transcriptional regulator [unclassified Leptolyngbya]MBD1909220.1 helix-turn-helix domain-containing protein [Leptolyngbya sp. FACHB-8]MBD2153558.1 helix-turn-helix domain-containing protein [Leptolyngbya sp. FACHB-16]
MSFTKSLPIPDLIRHLRQHLNLSQEKFAAQLGVSFKTVNRWENGHSLPSPMAMKLLEELLKSTGEAEKGLLQQDFSKGEWDV